MHQSCLEIGGEKRCRFKCFAELQHHIRQYTLELSRVFFRKKALQSDRRWWLCVFYSLLIQAPVRQTLIMIQAEINAGPLAQDDGPTPCSRYCYTVLHIFDAASAGWDPITSDKDLGTLLSGSDLDKDLAKHIKIARETTLESRLGDKANQTFEFLRNLFEMDVSERVRRRASAKGISIKNASATAPQPALSNPKASQKPHFSDSEHASTGPVKHHDSGTKSSMLPPPFPPTRFIPVEYWQFLRGERPGTIQRRATSPPQECDNQRQLSTDSFSPSLSTADDVSDRASSISSINSYPSINAAYGTLALESPGSGQSPRLMSSSTHSTTPDNTQQPDKPPAIGDQELIIRRSAKLRTGTARKVQGFYTCDCCPNEPEKFDTHEELG